MNAELQSQIKKLDSISTAPAILMPLLEMLRTFSDEISIEQVVELISCDGAIAAQCLRLANSPLFGRRQTETVRSAVMALGLERVRSVLFGLCVNRVVPHDKWVLRGDAFWRHSLGCALTTQRMAKSIEYREPEKAYLAGLLHDIGFLVNSVLCTEPFRECVARAEMQHLALHEIEKQVLGFTHCESGQFLCQHWGLPQELAAAAGCHHDPSRLVEAGPVACLVHLSDLLCRVRFLGYGYDEILEVELGRDIAWQVLLEAYPALRNLDLLRFTLDIEGAMDQIAATVDSVFGPSPTNRPITNAGV